MRRDDTACRQHCSCHPVRRLAILDGASATALWLVKKIPLQRGWQAVASAAIGPLSETGKRPPWAYFFT